MKNLPPALRQKIAIIMKEKEKQAQNGMPNKMGSVPPIKVNNSPLVPTQVPLTQPNLPSLNMKFPKIKNKLGKF